MELSSFDVNLFSVSLSYGTFFIIEKGWSFNFNILPDHSHAAFMQRYVMPCLFPLSIISLLNTSLCFINKSGNEYSIVPSFTGVDKGGTRGHRRVKKKRGGGGRKSVGKWSMPLHKLPRIMCTKKKCRFHRIIFKNLPIVGGGTNAPPRSPSLCPPPPPVDKSWLHHRHWRSYMYKWTQGRMPPPPVDRSKKKWGKERGRKGLPSPVRSLRSLAMPPTLPLKNPGYAAPVPSFFLPLSSECGV